MCTLKARVTPTNPAGLLRLRTESCTLVYPWGEAACLFLGKCVFSRAYFHLNDAPS